MWKVSCFYKKVHDLAIFWGLRQRCTNNQISFGNIRFVFAYQYRINTMRKQATDTDIHKHLFKGTRALVIS